MGATSIPPRKASGVVLVVLFLVYWLRSRHTTVSVALGELKVGACMAITSDPAAVPQAELRQTPSFTEGLALRNTLYDRWNEALALGITRTPFVTQQTVRRVWVGRYPLTLVLNLGRAQKRQPILIQKDLARVDLKVPFDDSKFHFGKVDGRERLLWLSLQSSSSLDSGKGTERSASVEEASMLNGLALREEFLTCVPTPNASTDQHVAMINVFPLSEFSGFLVPFLNRHLPQDITPDAIQLTLILAQYLKGDGMRLGYNSMHAGASVNHLHIQFWTAKRVLPIEMATTQPIQTRSQLEVGVTAHASTDFPLHFVRVQYTATTIDQASTLVAQAAEFLAAYGCPFNMVFTDTTVYIILRKSISPHHRISVGFPEAAGDIFITNQTMFDSLDSAYLSQVWLSHLRAEDEAFNQLLSNLQHF
eukprot:m.364208 g.364208  ORF g.364208 m.364208 type:complete len:420 (+) comp25998_c0_seq1:68-1327(+)